MKRILTVQDISCVGKCSLTVALPVISAMGVEAAVLPTAVLSAHSVFPGFTCKDLTDQIAPIARHWRSQGLGFDMIYTGYLTSFAQIDLVSQLIDDFKRPETLVFVDPAMADNGRLYAGFDDAFPQKMASLCAKADLIVPNITEAALLTGTPYRPQQDSAYARSLLLRLADLGARVSVLTGVDLGDGKTGILGYDRAQDTFFYYAHEKVETMFHGTGDIFASTCVGAMARGLDWKQALRLAADYTAQCIRVTLDDPTRPWYGVDFELALPYLIDRLKKALQTSPPSPTALVPKT